MRPKQLASLGFSLVEMSIVLVIVALMVGGIMTGVNLKRSADLQAVVKEVTNFKDAFALFDDKYMAIPGDMINATDFWGAEDGGDGLGSDCSRTASSGKATCNGDGNSYINPLSVDNDYERMRAWQHLANAGLIAGKYTGVGNEIEEGTPDYHLGCTPNKNCPSTNLESGSSYFITGAPSFPRFGEVGAMPGNYAHDQGHAVAIGSAGNNNGASVPTYPAFTTEEAYQIDLKMDDGKPGLGDVLTIKHDAGDLTFGVLIMDFQAVDDCATSAVEEDAEYNLSLSGKKCGLMFYID